VAMSTNKGLFKYFVKTVNLMFEVKVLKLEQTLKTRDRGLVSGAKIKGSKEIVEWHYCIGISEPISLQVVRSGLLPRENME